MKNKTIKSEFDSYIQNIKDDTEKAYIVERVIGQINWYSKKSSINQKRYKTAMVLCIAISALIPIVTISMDFFTAPWMKIVITALSSAVTAITAINALCNYRELWIEYRTNCELLKSELHKYLTSGKFGSTEEKQDFTSFMKKCENLLTKEYKYWALATASLGIDNTH